MTAKISDFGLATRSTHIAHMTGAGTPLYMAPEIFSSDYYTDKVDIYRFVDR